MLKHYGSRRTYAHNVQLATVLSFVAGIVNITGWLGLGIMTTNVTGNFAFLSEQILNKNFSFVILLVLFINAFLAGAFVSNYLVERGRRKMSTRNSAYVLPIALEIILVFIIASSRGLWPSLHTQDVWISFMLLFAMGLQNALVTRVSDSVVRTTHLTGLFTDLGIELSQFFFYKTPRNIERLKRSVFLRILIIIGFTLGGVIGGVLFYYFHFRNLYLIVFILLSIMIYDAVWMRFKPVGKFTKWIEKVFKVK